MVNRRLLRVKVIQILYSYYCKSEQSIEKSEKELLHSIQKSYELYHLFLLLIIEIKEYSLRKIERNREKKLPSDEDLNPNTRFVENKFVALLEENSGLKKFLVECPTSWVEFPDLIKKLYHDIVESDIYIEYMGKDACTFEDDKNLWLKIFKKIIPDQEELGQILEEKSVYWNDDALLVLGMVQKTIKKFSEKEGSENSLMPLFKDNDDRDFVIKLFRMSILNADKNRKLLAENTSNWDFERLAFMDILNMQIALAEISECVHITVKVSLNE